MKKIWGAAIVSATAVITFAGLTVATIRKKDTPPVEPVKKKKIILDPPIVSRQAGYDEE